VSAALAALPPRPGPPQAEPLPPLREDLALLPGPVTADGAPTWTLHDPVANRYFRLGWVEFEMLSRWGLGTAEGVVASLGSETPLHVEPEEVAAFARFAQTAGLTRIADRAGTERLVRQADARRVHPMKWLLKNYLFLRIPLIRPDRLLAALLPLVGVAFTRGFWWCVGLAAALGLFLVARQWETFTRSLIELTTLEGLAMTGGALALAKLLHEFGHAVAAKRYGCRVPSMGIAFMVLCPILWTDTTEAWRLTSRRQRMVIDAAGMLAELALAAAASVAWSFLPAGPLRDGVFLLATTTWIMTLAVNLNPLMRFDGYFLMADWLDLPNLQERAFALTRWWLRERVFGFGDPPPEWFPPRRARFLIGYSLAIWIYRLVLFLGIALLVYHMFFKALGLFLMLVEVGWFIVRPITAEIAAWLKRRRDVRLTPRTLVSFGLLAGALGLLFVPWQGEISVPAVLRAERQAVVYALEPGRIAELHARLGQRVAEGEVLFTLDAPDLAHRIASAGQTLRALQADVAAQSLDPEAVQQLPVTWQELERAVADLESLLALKRNLVVRAPFAGIVADLPEGLKPGAWIAAREPLGLVLGGERALVEGLVAEEDLGRVEKGARARFYPEARGMAPLDAGVERVDSTALRTLEHPELASANGGGVAARPDGAGKPVPEQSTYRVLLTPRDVTGIPPQTARGTALISGERQSWAGRLWRIALGVLIRESSLS